MRRNSKIVNSACYYYTVVKSSNVKGYSNKKRVVISKKIYILYINAYVYLFY